MPFADEGLGAQQGFIAQRSLLPSNHFLLRNPHD